MQRFQYIPIFSNMQPDFQDFQEIFFGISSESLTKLETMSKPTDFKIIFDQLARRVGLDRAELLRRVGMSDWAYYKWRDGNEPSPDNLRRIEYEFGVEFIRNEEGRVVEMRPSEALPARGTEVEKKEETETSVPASAREFYENFEFHGGKPEWLELDDATQSFYENLHSFLLRRIDSANEKYAASLREIQATRDRDIREAMEEFERTFRKRMLGILGG